MSGDKECSAVDLQIDDLPEDDELDIWEQTLSWQPAESILPADRSYILQKTAKDLQDLNKQS